MGLNGITMTKPHSVVLRLFVFVSRFVQEQVVQSPEQMFASDSNNQIYNKLM